MIFSVMRNFNKIKAVQELFKQIKEAIGKSDSKEDLPNENEKKSREELDKQ